MEKLLSAKYVFKIIYIFYWTVRGLLGGHVMAEELKRQKKGMQWYKGELLEMATDLGDRLLPAFNTSTGIPFPKVSKERRDGLKFSFYIWMRCCVMYKLMLKYLSLKLFDTFWDGDSVLMLNGCNVKSFWWKDACKRDMSQVGLKEDNTTNRAAWRNKIISYTGDPRWRDKPGKKKKNVKSFWIDIFQTTIILQGDSLSIHHYYNNMTCIHNKELNFSTI